MNRLRVHRKVWLWWGRWWAAQLVFPDDGIGIGLRIEPRRPLLDIFLPFLTLSFGKHPVLTDARTRGEHSCRGYIIVEKVL